MNSYCPKNKQDWRKWLQKNHLKEESIWLIINKKNAPNPNLTWSEAVDEALCYGWIDSVRMPIDENQFKQYFSKRKPKSNWSKINKDKVTILIENGLMQDAGYKSIEIAKKNGSWTILDKIESLEVPNDLKEALENQKDAMEFFEGLSKSDKKILLHWVFSAKRDETRRKRILEVVENVSNKQLPNQFRRKK
ncbi:MAG: YdeI/OmpD-associated family protein [bacterium]|nr:YdeI/OmpD-associated family protein [bacterium]